MREYLENLVAQALLQAQDAEELPAFTCDDLGFTRPQDPANGDWSSTIALRSAKKAHMSPRDIATTIKNHLPQDAYIEKTEVAGPGFLNFYLTTAANASIILEVQKKGFDFGRVNDGEQKYVQVEFVSANPVGPMHIGHGRWAALGDSLCRILEHAGWKVQREFYVNDAGSQMDVFGRSIDTRYMQLANLIKQDYSPKDAYKALISDNERAMDDEGDHPLNDEFRESLGEDAYGGSYIITLAYDFYKEDKGSWVEADETKRKEHFKESGYKVILEKIDDTLKEANVYFDNYFSERSLLVPDENNKNSVDYAIELLRHNGYVYEKDGATWLKTTDFDDDKDRVLVKSDGSYTYFAPDVAYHLNKFGRGFDRVINIWGADHHGYVQRMQAAMAASGHAGKLDVLLGQLVNLLRGGSPIKMSKRRGTMITFDELLDEVGVDATRFTLVSRSSNQEIDFDIDLVKSQSSDNPVYYVQYAHARICSIIKKAAETLLNSDMSIETIEEIDNVMEQISKEEVNLSLLNDEHEQALISIIEKFPDLISSAARDLAPHRIAYYTQDLASSYHTFYAHCQVISDDIELTKARLSLCDATRRVLALSLSLIGVSAPVSM